MFKSDIRRAFTSISFYAIVVITFFSVTYEFFAAIYHAWFVMKVPWGRWGADSITGFRFLTRTTLLPFLYPLLCVLPYGTSLSDEISSGAARMIVFRTGRARYLYTRLLSVAISGGIACALSMTLIALFSWIAFPLNENLNPQTVEDLSRISILFSNLKEYTPDVFFKFSGWCILMSFVGGCIWSVVSMGISVWFPNRYFAMAAPVVVYSALIMLWAITNGDFAFIFPCDLFIDSTSIGGFWRQLIFRSSWLAMGVISYYFGGRRIMKNV